MVTTIKITYLGSTQGLKELYKHTHTKKTAYIFIQLNTGFNGAPILQLTFEILITLPMVLNHCGQCDEYFMNDLRHTVNGDRCFNFTGLL